MSSNNNNNLNLGNNNNNNNLNNLLNNNSGNKSKNSNKNKNMSKNNVSNKLNNRRNNSGTINSSIQNKSVRTKSNYTSGGFSMVSVFIIVVILVILYFSGKFVYDYYNNNKPDITYKHLVDGMVDGKNPFEIAPSQMPTGIAGTGYSLSFWIIVNDYKNYRYGQNKYILRRGSVKGNVNPEVYLHPYNNTLQVNISNIFKKEDLEKDNISSTNSNEPNNNNSNTKETTLDEESTTTTAQSEESTFVNIPTDEDIREGFTTCNCGEVKTNKEIMCEVNSNVVTRQREPDYNNDMFSLIQGNVIDSSEITHNKEQNFVMEQFKDKENFDSHSKKNNDDCECEDSEVVTDTDRKDLEENSSILEIPDFPLQTPVHVVISLHNNQVLDVFINGKLNKVGSKHIAAPEMVLDELVLGPDGGFDGKIGSLFYVNNPLSAREVRDLYHKGMNYTPGFFSKIPNYVYVILVLLVVFAIVYSMMM